MGSHCGASCGVLTRGEDGTWAFTFEVALGLGAHKSLTWWNPTTRRIYGGMPWVQPVPSEEVAMREKDRDIINLWIPKDEAKVHKGNGMVCVAGSLYIVRIIIFGS